MKKLSIIIILILVTTLIIMPTIVGRVAEQATYELLDRLKAKSGKYGELILVDYQRGFRETNFNFSWKENQENIYLNEPLTINCTGTHGVISYSHQCSVSSIDFQDLTEGTQTPVSLTGEFSLFGEVSEIITFNKFDLHQSHNSSIYFLPTVINVASDDGLTNFDIKAKSEGYKLFTQNKKLIVTNFNLEGGGALNTHKFIIGNVTASSESVSIESANNDKFIFEGLTINARTEEQGQNINLEQKLNANTYLHDKSEAVDLKNLNFDFKLSGVDMAQLALLNEKIESISKHTKSQTNASFIRLIPVFQGLLKPNLTITTKFSADHISNQIITRAEIKLVDSLSFGDVLMLKLNPRGVFAKVNANYYSIIPQSILDKDSQSHNAVSNNAWYVKTETGYGSELKMVNGEAILNNRQLSIEEMLLIIGR